MSGLWGRTIHRRTLLVASEVLRGARSGVQPRWTLRATEMRWKTSGLLGLLGRRCKSWTTLIVPCHDTAKKIAGPMPDRGGLGLGGAVMLRVLAGSAACFELALQACDLILVPDKR